MPTALEKARQTPDSVKTRILSAARKLFGEYGFHGVTTRMIAKEVGIDISTLHYHWGDKQNLYESVLTDLSDEIHHKLVEIETLVQGKPLAVRLDVAIEVMCDYLLENPDSANLLLFSHFSKNRITSEVEAHITRHLTNIAVAMGLAVDKDHVAPQAHARVLAVWNAVINFAAGENFFRPLLKIDTQSYAAVVKETLKFILIPAFTLAKGGTEEWPSTSMPSAKNSAP
ncbi:MAG: TetR/AcrR family transcriptional regulator [Desulfobacteraceae bacterium]|nr:TetR/AcrR family transcriptional regulator [Desulfobacteraceae bacterium]